MSNGGSMKSKEISFREIITALLFTALALTGCGQSGGGGGVDLSAGLESISVTPSDTAITEGASQQFQAIGAYENGSTKDITGSVTWASLDPAVVTVKTSSGLATSVGPGSTTITASLSGVSGSATLMTAAIILPRTGQQTAYASGDDGGLQKGIAWPSPRFVVSGNCVTDKLTGLMWPKSPDPAQKTWEDALDYTGGLSLCGYSDWRMPNINELESLYNAEETYSTDWLNTEGFSLNPMMEDYGWTSTTYASDTTSTWYVVMWNGDMAALPKGSKWNIWPVRTDTDYIVVARLPATGQTVNYVTGDDGELQEGVAWPGSRFIVSGDCVTDRLTGLMWSKSPDPDPRTWKKSLDYAGDLSLCGYSDWRLPNRKELRSLVNYGEAGQAAWLNNQGFTDVQAGVYWTSTTYGFDTGFAWYLNLEAGEMLTIEKLFEYPAWPVRAGR